MRISLTTERAEYEAPFLRLLGRPDGPSAQILHLPVIVRLAGEFPRIGIVAVSGQRRVMDHGGLEMEAAVAEVEDDGVRRAVALRQARRRAAEDLALAEGRGLRDQDVEAGALEDGLQGVEGGVELDGAYRGDCLAGLEVALQGREEMGCVDADIDEDVESLDLCDVHRYETAVRVVYQDVTSKRSSGVIVYATGSVGDVAHDECLGPWAELCQDV